MKYSKEGHFYYDTPLETCFLTGGDLVDTDPKSTYKYRSYQKKVRTGQTFYKVFLLLNFISLLACMYIDWLLDHQITWSLTVSTSNAYAILAASIFYFSITMIPRFIMMSILTISYLTLIGLYHDNIHWAIDYIMPFIIISVLFILSLMLLIHRKSYYDLVAYIFMFSLLSLLPGLFNLLSLTKTTWPGIVSSSYGIITLLSIFFLSSKESKEEFKRRFHI